MSPIVDLQRRLRELGRIRMGEQRTSGKGKRYPAALDRFRFTSPSRGILGAMVATVGGSVRSWEDAPGEAPQWELYSDASEIVAACPPVDEPYSQWYELWSAAGCQRRCNGERATVAVSQGEQIVMRERSCMCDPEARECKLTTRASLILPWAPGIGVWRIEGHGYNMAVEFTGTLAFMAMQARQGLYTEFRIRLDQRRKRVPGQPEMQFVVPVIETDSTPAQLMSGQAAMPATSLPVTPARPAIPAGESAPSGEAAAFGDPDGRADGSSWGSPPEVPSGEAAEREASGAAPEPITDAQRRRLFAIAGEHQVDEPTVKRVVRWIAGVESTKSVPRDAYDSIVATVEKWPASQDALKAWEEQELFGAGTTA